MNSEITDFEKDVIGRSHQIPVVADFWAEWCGPCRMLGPILEKLAEEFQGQWQLAKVNTEIHQAAAARFRISSIPHVKLFVDGQPKDQFSGALPERAVRKWLQKCVPGRHQKALDQALTLLHQGDLRQAASLARQILDSDPENAGAKILLARVTILHKPDEALTLLESMGIHPEQADLVQGLKDFARILSRNPNSLPDGEAKTGYATALKALKKHDMDAALSQFVESMRESRQYDQDGARKACIAIFKFLGEDHPLTLKHRRTFGSALNV